MAFKTPMIQPEAPQHDITLDDVLKAKEELRAMMDKYTSSLERYIQLDTIQFYPAQRRIIEEMSDTIPPGVVNAINHPIGDPESKARLGKSTVDGYTSFPQRVIEVPREVLRDAPFALVIRNDWGSGAWPWDNHTVDITLEDNLPQPDVIVEAKE